MDAHIQVRELNVDYGGHPALKNVSVEIPKGQITAIMGPSGCGKTTLLKSMNRLLEVADGARVTGQVLIDGVDIYDPAGRCDRDSQKGGPAGAAAVSAADVDL